MPLLDHFRPPLTQQVRWQSVHGAWATFIAASLNRQLPARYRAIPFVQFGIEIDVATLDFAPTQRPSALREVVTVPYFTLATTPSEKPSALSDWLPSAPTQTIPFALFDEQVEVLIYSDTTEPALVGAVELVSRANKDRPAERQAFVAKCEAYLRQGVGLVIVDIVTELRANLHDELLTRLGAQATLPSNSHLYTTAYHPVRQDEQVVLEMWQEALIVGQALPIMPLWLRREHCAPLDLNATYEETCHSLRITAPQEAA
jgi:hypothetical protein